METKMSKKRMHATPAGRKDRNFVGVIDANQLREMTRAGFGELHAALKTKGGQGAHGGSKREKNRAERRKGKLLARDSSACPHECGTVGSDRIRVDM
jgi:hypothetical protein